MTKIPLVTIVTATRNRQDLLLRLIKSVMAQTYANIEHVIVDGLSDDGTQDMIKSYEKKYRLRWISEKDRNQVEALNKGLRLAKGEFVTITHDDDYWLPHGIEILVKTAEKYPKLDIVYGDSWGEYANGKRIRRTYRKYSLHEMVNQGYQIPQDGALFRSKWLREIGYLRENMEYVPEYELFLRIIRDGGIYDHISEITSVGGIHEAKKSWIGAKRSWEETRHVNRLHGGSFFSRFTFLYYKNRYFSKPARFLKTHFPSLIHKIRKIIQLPDY